MPDLPKIEDPTEVSATVADPEATSAALRRLPRIGTVAMIAALALVALYGAAGFLRETGLYEVGSWWAKPAASPRLAHLSDPPVAAPFAPKAAAPPPAAPAMDGDPKAVRDPLPRLPPADLPQFTLRDGEPHDFLTDLDAETLKRLAEIQGQLDGLVTLAKNLHQAVQTLTRTAGQQRQQEAAHQSRLQAELAAARQEIAALHAAVEEVEARLKRARGGPGAVAFESDGAVLPGWSVKAISGDRAWLKTPKGQEVTVVAGERLKALGAVRTVDAARGIVVMGDGRVVR